MASGDTYCIENGEEFKIGSFNGVSLIYRVSDKYVNAGKMCKDIGKQFYSFSRGQLWNDNVKYWERVERLEDNCLPSYELRKGYKNAQGMYVHPDLIHFVAEWISVEYRFKVKRIMNMINEQNQITNQSLEDTIKKLQAKLDKVKSSKDYYKKLVYQSSNISIRDMLS
jgi:hypothetical protein